MNDTTLIIRAVTCLTATIIAATHTTGWPLAFFLLLGLLYMLDITRPTYPTRPRSQP